MDCIFCKIANKKVLADIIYEDDEIMAFKDVHPLAPVHVLIIPKKHIKTINDLEREDETLAGKIVLVAKKIAVDQGVSDDGYKLLFRVKKHGGQEVDHIHLHLIGGAQLYEEIRPLN